MTEKKSLEKFKLTVDDDGTQAEDIKDWNIVQRLHGIMGELEAMPKEGKNTAQKYEYHSQAQVARTIKNLMVKYRVLHLPQMAGIPTLTHIKNANGSPGIHSLTSYIFTFINIDKPDDRLDIPWAGEAIDYGDKATNKTGTSAQKYMFLRLFLVAEPDKNDPDNDGPEPPHSRPTPPPPPAPLKETPTLNVEIATVGKSIKMLGGTPAELPTGWGSLPEADRKEILRKYKIHEASLRKSMA
jgi:hypothetical protein